MVGILRELFGWEVRQGKRVVYDTYLDQNVPADVVLPDTDDEEEEHEPKQVEIQAPPPATIDYVLVAAPPEPALPRGRPRKSATHGQPVAGQLSIFQRIVNNANKKRPRVEDID